MNGTCLATQTRQCRRWKRTLRFLGKDPRYGPERRQLPATECLKDTVERFLPYWHERSHRQFDRDEENIAAHMDSLRRWSVPDDVPDEEIVSLNIPTGVPLV
jgi:2,3-bisphosphoglycerate-dependent phosphoglycerate mutase